MFATPAALTKDLSASVVSGLTLTPSWDLLIFLVFFGAIFLYGLSSGRDRLIILILSVYFSSAIINAMPWEALAGFFENEKPPSSTFETFLFFAIVVAISFLMPRSILGSKFRTVKAGRGSVLYILIFSICALGILTTITMSFLSAKAVVELNPLLIQLFWNNEAKFFWILVPILFLILLRPGKTEV